MSNSSFYAGNQTPEAIRSSGSIATDAISARDAAIKAANAAVTASNQADTVSSRVKSDLASGVLNLSSTFLGFTDGLLKGTKGDQGVPGPAGPTGAKGDTGLQGATGPAGVPGTMGTHNVTISTSRPAANTGVSGDFWIVIPS